MTAVTSRIVKYLPLLILALLWEMMVRTGIISKLMMPPLSQVLVSWWDLASTGELVKQGAASLKRMGTGLGLAVVIGTTAGVLMAWYKPVRMLVNPVVQMFYPMPKSALIPVMILWFGLGDLSKVILIFLGCLLPIVVSSYNGARGVDQHLIWSARSLGASELNVLGRVVLPGAMPEILAGLRTALAVSFVLLVSSEFLIAKDGLGYLISGFGDGGVYEAMFACILTVVAMGFIADRVFQIFMRRMLSWRE